MEKRIKIANIVLTLVITIGFCLLGYFVFAKAYIRIFESLCDLFESIKYYICQVFKVDIGYTITVTKPSHIYDWSISMPEQPSDFVESTTTYFEVFASKANFNLYLKTLGVGLSNFARWSVIFLPCIFAVIMLVKMVYGRTTLRHNKDTVPLLVYRWVSKYTFVPVKDFVKQYIEYVKTHSPIWVIWLIIWCCHLNIATIIFEFLAYYLYFALSLDVVNLYMQVCKLFIDLQNLFKGSPLIASVIVIEMFRSWRKRVAKNRLRRLEARNCGFINDLPIVSMTCGSMGKRKTTMITDMALSQEAMFRQKAFELLQKNDMKFPHFAWIAFEDELKKCIEHHTVYNLATCKEFVRKKRERFFKHFSARRQLYGYDLMRYGFVYDDGINKSTLFDILETYAQLYFIYIITSSLIVSNYSIRSDNAMLDNGNFPLWVTDFFPEILREGRRAHVLDFDTLRLGKKVVEDNPNIGSFEFGVVVISEVGKERGNNLELKEVKRGTDETNQKNDLFNAWLKMCRHSATVDNFPFIKVFADEQRPESWGADARDLCDIVRINSTVAPRLTLPFYNIEGSLANWAFAKFINLYYDFRYRRGDNTLLVYVLKNITSAIYRHNIRLWNKYGYSQLKVECESGTMDGKPSKKTYYLMHQKIYSHRFSTDCFSDYFNDLAKKAHIGLNDYVEYATERATIDELKKQNSYFIGSLYK